MGLILPLDLIQLPSPQFLVDLIDQYYNWKRSLADILIFYDIN